MIFFPPTRSQNLIVTPKIGNLPKMRFEEIKLDTPEPQLHLIPRVEKQKKVTS